MTTIEKIINKRTPSDSGHEVPDNILPKAIADFRILLSLANLFRVGSIHLPLPKHELERRLTLADRRLGEGLCARR